MGNEGDREAKGGVERQSERGGGEGGREVEKKRTKYNNTFSVL